MPVNDIPEPAFRLHVAAFVRETERVAVQRLWLPSPATIHTISTVADN